MRKGLIMMDEELIEQLETATLDPDAFTHENHVRAGWLYVRAYPLAKSIERFSEMLKRYTKSVGAEAKYHETITWFYMLAIAERQTKGAYKDFRTFLAENRDFVDAKPSLLSRYYTPETLASEHARQHYVLPDTGMTQAV